MPPCVKDERSLVGEFGVTVRALVWLVLAVNVAVIKKIGPGLERSTAHVANKRSVVRMNESMPLE